MDFALRCAFAHGTGALRTHIDSIGKQTAISWRVFAEMREHVEGPRRAAGGRRSIRSNSRSTTRRSSAPWWRRSRSMAACSAGSPLWANRSAPKTDAALDKVFEAAHGERPRSRFPCGRERFTGRALARADRRRRAAPQVLRPDRRRPLLLARARRRCRARRHHRQGGGSAHRGRVAADVQHVSAGPRRPAARRAGAASRRCMSSPPPASP